MRLQSGTARNAFRLATFWLCIEPLRKGKVLALQHVGNRLPGIELELWFVGGYSAAAKRLCRAESGGENRTVRTRRKGSSRQPRIVDVGDEIDPFAASASCWRRGKIYRRECIRSTSAGTALDSNRAQRQRCPLRLRATVAGIQNPRIGDATVQVIVIPQNSTVLPGSLGVQLLHGHVYPAGVPAGFRRDQNVKRTPPLITLPSSGAQASTVHLPSDSRFGRSKGSQRV